MQYATTAARYYLAAFLLTSAFIVTGPFLFVVLEDHHRYLFFLFITQAAVKENEKLRRTWIQLFGDVVGFLLYFKQQTTVFFVVCCVLS